jgi:hypothetical protein
MAKARVGQSHAALEARFVACAIPGGESLCESRDTCSLIRTFTMMFGAQ